MKGLLNNCLKFSNGIISNDHKTFPVWKKITDTQNIFWYRLSYANSYSKIAESNQYYAKKDLYF